MSNVGRLTVLEMNWFSVIEVRFEAKGKFYPRAQLWSPREVPPPTGLFTRPVPPSRLAQILSCRPLCFT
jgi:hypothetical protein